MEINLNKKSSTEASIKIRLNKSDYQTQVEKKVNDYARKANLKGFRQGKVPPGVIRKMYGKSILVEEINHILSHKLSDYIRENDLKILGEPLPDKESTSKIDWDNQEDFEFDYNIGLVDEFDLDISKKQKVKKYVIEVDKKSLDNTLEDILKRFGKETEAETSEDEDVLEADVSNSEGTVDKKEVRVNLTAVSKKSKKKFTGLKVGDIVSIDAEKIFDDHLNLAQITGLENEAAAQLKGKLSIKVNGIIRKEKADYNQELYDAVFGPGEVQDKDTFVKKVEETVGENYNREAENHFKYTVRKHFIDNTKLELPDSFMKEWLTVTNDNLSEEDLEREYDGYAESLKWNLILSRVASENNITVENDDVRNKAKEMIVSQFGGMSALGALEDKIDPIVDNYLQSENGKHYSDIHEQLRNEKILDHIEGQISVTEKKVKFDEFTKIVEKEFDKN